MRDLVKGDTEGEEEGLRFGAERVRISLEESGEYRCFLYS
jgi:hypothetical protein